MKIIYKERSRFNSIHSPEVDLNSFGIDGWQLCSILVIPRENGPEEIRYVFSKQVEE